MLRMTRLRLTQAYEFPYGAVTVISNASSQKITDHVAYHIVDSDPHGEKTIGAIPLSTRRFRGQKLFELRHLVDN